MERNENGYSNFLFGNRNRTVTQNENERCPGTGDIWRGDNNTNGNNIGGNTNNMHGNMNGGCLGGASSNCAQRQLAMVYSPYQCWRMLYSPDEALNHGCLFEELNKPLEEY